MRLLILFLLLSQAAQCQQSQTKGLVKNPEFDKLVDSYLNYDVEVISVDQLNNNKAVVILDAREAQEYMMSHIPNAKHIGYKNPRYEVVSDTPKDTEIVIYCSIGYRSEKIGAALQKKGFTNVSNLYGSLFEWANRGYPLEDSAGRPTNKIHGYSKKWSQWILNKDLEVKY